MQTLLAGMLAFLLPMQAQDLRLLKSAEPNYGRYNEQLATDFETTSASVTLGVLANGKPFSLDQSSVPLPLAVVKALQEYEFQPQGETPHGRPEIDAVKYQVTLNVPIRQSKDPAPMRINPGVSKGNLTKRVAPEHSEYIRFNRIHGTIKLEAVIGKQGEVAGLRAIHGPFVLIEAAYDAVRLWEFRPYLLNRQPVEVLTDIEVVF
jgi:hypothetical protein